MNQSRYWTIKEAKEYSEYWPKVVAYVEATSFERFKIITEFRSFIWNHVAGTGFYIGSYNKEQVNVSFSFFNLNGKLICFYYPNSLVIDWGLVKKTIQNQMKLSKFSPINVDAFNFHHVIEKIQDLKCKSIRKK